MSISTSRFHCFVFRTYSSFILKFHETFSVLLSSFSDKGNKMPFNITYIPINTELCVLSSQLYRGRVCQALWVDHVTKVRCDAVLSATNMPTFRRNVPPSSGRFPTLKMNAASFFRKVSFYTTLHGIPCQKWVCFIATAVRPFDFWYKLMLLLGFDLKKIKPKYYLVKLPVQYTKG